MDGPSTIKLKSNDGLELDISQKAAERSGLIKGVLEDYPEDSAFPCSEVKGKTLEKVVEYLKHYENEEPPEIDRPLKEADFSKCVSNWDFNFLGDDIEMIIEILSASSYLNINSLQELACAKLGSMIRGVTSDTIKKNYGLKQEYTEDDYKMIDEDKLKLEKML